MKAISVRRFVAEVKTLTEPVIIVTFDREQGAVVTLGHYYPKGTEPEKQRPKNTEDLVEIKK